MARRRSRKQNHSGFKKLGCLFVLLVVLVTAVGVFRQFPNVWIQGKAFVERQFQPDIPPLEPRVALPEPSVSSRISPDSHYDNLALGVPGKADTVIDVPPRQGGHRLRILSAKLQLTQAQTKVLFSCCITLFFTK